MSPPHGVPSVAGGQERRWGGHKAVGRGSSGSDHLPCDERGSPGLGALASARDGGGPGAALRGLTEPWIAEPLRAPGLSAHGEPGVQGGAAQVPWTEPARPAGALPLRARPVSIRGSRSPTRGTLEVVGGVPLAGDEPQLIGLL